KEEGIDVNKKWNLFTLKTKLNEQIKALESQIQSQPITDKSTEETLAELIKNIQDLNKKLD
ncbi:42806_t:CDS:1, partial [Gigaspora margarita]